MDNNNIKNVTTVSCNLYVSGVSDSKKSKSGNAYAIIDNSKTIGPNIEVYSKYYSDITDIRATLLAIVSGCDRAEKKGFNKIIVKTSQEFICNMINQNWLRKWKKNNWIKEPSGEKVKNLDLIKTLYELTEKIEIQASFLKKNEDDDIMKLVRDESKTARTSGIISKTDTPSKINLGSKITTSKGDNPNNKSKRIPRIIELKKRKKKQLKKQQRKKKRGY